MGILSAAREQASPLAGTGLLYLRNSQVAFEKSYEAAARGARIREFRWKNSAWLTTADTMAGWNGFEIRNAGSGRSPVRNRSG